jgi:spore coat protein U-like protein
MSARSFVAAILCALALPLHAATCTVNAVAMSWGQVDSLRMGTIESTGNITVACIGMPGESVRYSLLLGAGQSGRFGARRLESAQGPGPGYNLYIDPARTLVWGDGSAGTAMISDVFTLIGHSISRSHTVYGRLIGRPDARAGAYSDSILVTLKI